MDRSKDDHRLVVRNVPVIAGGEIQWPAKCVLTDEEAARTGKVGLEDKKRQVGSIVFSVEMLNQSVDKETSVVKPEHFPLPGHGELSHKRTRNFLTIDTKGIEAKFDGTDYIDLTLNFVDSENNWHFISRRMKLSTAEVVDLMFNWYARGLEIIGYEKASFTEGMKAYLDTKMRRRNKFLPLQSCPTARRRSTSVSSKAWSPATTAAASTTGGEPCEDLEDELELPTAVNDDASDSAAYQSEVAQPPGNVQERASVTETRRRLTNNQAR